MIREVLQFNDQESDPIKLPAGTVEAILPRLSYEGKYPSLVKKFVHPYWCLLVHMFILCMTENRGGTDQLNITQSAAFVSLIRNHPFNYSKYIFGGMKRNVIGVQKDKFLMYPRFLQMVFNARYPELVRSGNTLELKLMGPACFGALTPKKGTEKRFEGLIPLEKFGQFAETEDIAAKLVLVQPAPVNAAQINALVKAIIAEEHTIQGAVENEPETEILTINSDDEGIEISCDDEDEAELPAEANVSSAVSAIQQPVITSKSLAQLLKSITKNMGNPPSNPSVHVEEQTSSDPKDPDSLPLKRKRRGPRPGMYDVDVTSTEIPVATTVSDPVIDSTPPVITTIAGSSGTTHEEPYSSCGKWPEEPLRMLFNDDSSDDEEFISIIEMKKRLVVLEQDSIHKDAKIIQLEDTILQKNQQIDQLQGDVSLLFNMVYDLRGKLEKKFGREFSDPTDVESRRKADEDKARAFAKDDAERNAAMEHYFKKVTDIDANKAKAERIKKKREFVILKNKNPNPEDEDAHATHHLMDVGETLYDKVGNRSGVVSWGFDHDRKRWWTKRKVGPIEWYKNPAQFQTFTKVDLITLSKSPCVDDKPGGSGYLFFERLQREVARDFPSMHTAESIVTPAAKGVRDPYTNKRMKIVSWPPTEKEKTIPLVKKIPKGALKTMNFWAYDEQLGQAVIVCDDEVSFRLVDQVDLLNLAQEDLEVLARSQIRATEKYEDVANGWTVAVASTIHIRTKGFGGFKDRLDGGSGN
ncbi:hypothetical protein HanOQP8_Chr10g0369331 [Helianthus annuus]|nr:hypothetical protein HanOQP8_Chr10g0369331 [Helianthus annuus]KAJ0884141.1 hypothetical protein HanPSC8_Chr10g0429951 [Helianthus annuus]